MASLAEQHRAAMLLRAGQLIGLPTETVYGLAADASIEAAVNEIYRVKGRPSDHPLIVHIENLVHAEYWAEFSEQAHPYAVALAQAFWPGPMTLIMNRRASAPDFACAGQTTIGLRVPSHEVAQGVLKSFHGMGGRGIAAPSANRFGRISPTSAQHVRDDLGDDIAWVLEGGEAQVGIESTIIDLSGGSASLRVLRPGQISSEQISKVLGVAISDTLVSQQKVKSMPKVSGSLDAHYAPVTPMHLVDGESLPMRAAEYLNAQEKLVLWVSADLAIFLERVFGRQVPPEYLKLEIAAADPEVFAQELYARLRNFDTLGVERILIESLPETPEWAAIQDRLKRAQTGSGQS